MTSPQQDSAICPNPLCRSEDTEVAQDHSGLTVCLDCGARFPPKDTSFSMAEPRASIDIRRGIRRFLNLWGNDDEMPPVSPEELVMMALCLRGPLTALEIHDWIHESFAWFRRMAYQTAWSQRFCAVHGMRMGIDHPYPMLPDKISEVLLDLDFPFRKLKGDTLEINFYTDKWAITSSSALPFLRGSLQHVPEAQKVFRFMDLPPEIRILVYEHLLQFSQSGLMMKKFGMTRGVEAVVLTRELGAKLDLNRWNGVTGFEETSVFRQDKFSRRLSLFLVSKQVFAEAMPVFFGVNNFVFPFPSDLAKFLEITPPRRLQHVQHLSFNWTKFYLPSKKDMNHMVKILKDMPHLSQIDMHVNESAIMELEKSDGNPKYSDITKVPIFEALRNLRGMERVTLHGDCDKVRELLVPEMMRPKTAAQSKTSKKRETDGATGKKASSSSSSTRRTTRAKAVDYKEESEDDVE